MIRQVLRSWQPMAVLAAIAFAVAVVAAVAGATGPDADIPTTADGFGEVTDQGTPYVHPGVRDYWAELWPDGTEDDGTGDGSPAFTGPPSLPGPDADASAGPKSAAGDQTGDRPQQAQSEGVPPTRVRIPSLEVDALTLRLGLEPDGEIEVPRAREDAGWWEGGPAPGAPGPTVVLGHVNDWAGPGVFSGLHALGPGDEVLVDREDGATVVYAVTAASLYHKDDFPTDLVYRHPSDRPVLRLVTCGGTLDRDDGSYDSNYIVFAEQVRIDQPAARPEEPA